MDEFKVIFNHQSKKFAVLAGLKDEDGLRYLDIEYDEALSSMKGVLYQKDSSLELKQTEVWVMEPTLLPWTGIEFPFSVNVNSCPPKSSANLKYNRIAGF